MTAHPVVTATLTPCPHCQTIGQGSCGHPEHNQERYQVNPDEPAVAKAEHDAEMEQSKRFWSSQERAGHEDIVRGLEAALDVAATPWTTVTDTGEVMRVEPKSSWSEIRDPNDGHLTCNHSAQERCDLLGHDTVILYRLIPVTEETTDEHL